MGGCFYTDAKYFYSSSPIPNCLNASPTRNTINVGGNNINIMIVIMIGSSITKAVNMSTRFAAKYNSHTMIVSAKIIMMMNVRAVSLISCLRFTPIVTSNPGYPNLLIQPINHFFLVLHCSAVG